MKARTCPNCSYKFSIADYARVLLKFRDDDFTCKKCRTRLSFNVGIRSILATIALLPMIGSSQILSYITEKLEITGVIAIALMVLTVITWMLLVLSFERFRKAE